MVTLDFSGSSILVSIVAALIYIPVKTYEGLQFSSCVPGQYLLVFLMAILTGVRWTLSDVLIAFPV
jgi:hypothetical protein